jgi:HD-like signal output (HDOD) protein
MLHDIGKLVLAANEEKEYGALVMRADREKVPLYKKELEVYEATHADIGAYLLGLWGLPDEIILAVERHHTLGADLGKKFNPVVCVHVAQNLLSNGARTAELDEKFLKECKLTGRIPAWEEALSEEVVA